MEGNYNYYLLCFLAPIHNTIMNLEREFQILQNEPSQLPADLNQSFGKLDDEERKKYETVSLLQCCVFSSLKHQNSNKDY